MAGCVCVRVYVAFSLPSIPYVKPSIHQLIDGWMDGWDEWQQ